LSDIDFDFAFAEGGELSLFAADKATTETKVKRIIQKARQKKRDDIGIEKGIRLTGIAD
jgi:Tfp pilus assembly ATPase PilU